MIVRAIAHESTGPGGNLSKKTGGQSYSLLLSAFSASALKSGIEICPICLHAPFGTLLAESLAETFNVETSGKAMSSVN